MRRAGDNAQGKSYRLDVILQSLRNGLRILRVLFGNDGQIADLVPIIDLEIFEGICKIESDLM